MKNIEFSLGLKKDLLLGDLYHSYFLGISNELEFNIRQFHYQSAIKQGKLNACARTGWINQIYLEIFLKKLDLIEGKASEEEQNNNEFEQQKAGIIDFINKTKKNYFSSFVFLKKKSNFKYSEEFLNFLLETNENLLPQDKNDKNNCFHQLSLLISLGREDAMPKLFNLLRMRQKIQGKTEEIGNEMKALSLKMKRISKIEMGYCMEKGIGFEKNITKLLQLYHDEIFLFLEDTFRIIYCLYRVGKILEKIEKMKEHAQIFFEICLLKIIIILKNDLNYESIYFLAKLYRRKNFKYDEKYSTIILSFLQEKLTSRPHLDFKLKMLLFQINFKLKMINPETKKIKFYEIKDKETQYFEEVLKKQPIYDYYINDNFSSYINQNFRIVIIKLDDRTELESSLSPNLKFKGISKQPEFSPFILKKIRKLESKLHFFNESDLDLSIFNENENLMSGIIKKNNQKVIVKGFKFKIEEIDRIIDFFNRIDFYIQVSCKYIIAIIGISYSVNSDESFTFYLLFERFSELFDSFLKRNINNYDILKEFGRAVETISSIEKCGLFSIGFKLSNFCLSNLFFITSK